MKANGYGETQPRLDDDRLPIVLVVLDGLGDRPIPELGGRTPVEAASTPNLDALTRAGASGWHLPFGWGPAPSSELAHWAMFGYGEIPFPGRAVLEGLGAGLRIPTRTAVVHAALRTSRSDGGLVWITGRAARTDDADAEALLGELRPKLARIGVQLASLGGRGEALLIVPGHAKAGVSDSDPFFETFHPLLRPMPCSPDDAALAATLGKVLLAARNCLLGSGVNTVRQGRGLPALDVLTTKWCGVLDKIPSFTEQTGVSGAAVTSSRLYRGLAAALGMPSWHITPLDDLVKDLEARLDAADQLITAGARFVHVHTKAPDDAGHSKQPYAKRDVLELIDRGLAGLAQLTSRAIVAVTGDHATPSVHGVLHSTDPTPLVVAGPTVRADEVSEFGEWPARRGWYGQVRAVELLPLLLNHANRCAFAGHRITAHPVIALADNPEPMRIDA